jgi:hypothetical protein
MKKNFYLLFISIMMSTCHQTKIEKSNSLPYDTDGMLMIDGKRTFILGSYFKSKSDNPFQELSEAGFNLIRISNKIDLIKAEKYGLKTWANLGYLNPENLEKNKENISNKIHSFKDYPALLAWEMVDEPAWKWHSAEARVQPEPLIETYKFIKDIDPNHLIYTNHAPVNLVSTLSRYNPSTDIVACDIYPVVPHDIVPTYALFPDGKQGDLLNTYISQVGEYTDKMRKVAGSARPLFMVLQGFAWEMLKNEAERDLKKILYPTREETRFMAYNAIIHGANGIIYWGTNYAPQPSSFWTDLKSVITELNSIKDVLASKSIKQNLDLIYHELGYSVDAGVEYIVKEMNGAKFLITANADRYPAKVSFRGLEGITDAQILFDEKNISFEKEEITQYYRPFDVQVYKLSGK